MHKRSLRISDKSFLLPRILLIKYLMCTDQLKHYDHLPNTVLIHLWHAKQFRGLSAAASHIKQRPFNLVLRKRLYRDLHCI